MAKVTEEQRKRPPKCAKKEQKTLSEFKEAFDLFDKDGNGYITKSELSTCVHYFGMAYSDKELDEHIKEYDTDGNKMIDFREYLEVVSNPNRQQAPNKEEVITAFKMFDRNKDGFVTVHELNEAMKSLGNKMSPAEIREMLDAADFNRDGKIDYCEFTTMMFS